MGYQVAGYKTFAFVLSAALAGTAGVAHAYLNRFVSPEELSALVSARGLLIVVVAGAAVWAPVLVAVLLTLGEDTLSSQTEHWLAVIGVVYVVVALYDGAWLRERVAGVLPDRLHRGRAALEPQEDA